MSGERSWIAEVIRISTGLNIAPSECLYYRNDTVQKVLTLYRKNIVYVEKRMDILKQKEE